MLYQAIDHCRACGSSRIPEVLSLGDFAISDFLESPDAFTDRAPLVLVRCEDCTLVQLRHTVDRDRLYRHYWYRSGTQPAMVSALRSVVAEATSRVALAAMDTVIDVGANDGTLLRMYPEGIQRVGVEPSATFSNAPGGLAWMRPGDHWWATYWPLADWNEPYQAKIITSLACFYDVDDPGAFVEGIKANLADDGIWINQMAYWVSTMYSGNFGDVCHEHLTYWTVHAFKKLLMRHGLRIDDYMVNKVNGGSIRFIIKHGEQADWRDTDSMVNLEMPRFTERISQQRRDVIKFLSTHTGVIGYGASTKGNTYLQYWGVTPNLVELIADRNPDKWGKYTPTGQKVISEEEMRARKPQYLLVLPWHFADAFVERERDLLDAGTKMLIPFPTLHEIGGGS